MIRSPRQISFIIRAIHSNFHCGTHPCRLASFCVQAPVFNFTFLSKNTLVSNRHLNCYSFFSNQYRYFCSDFIMSENRYIVGYAKLGTSSCKKCKQKIEKGALRVGKVVSNPFSDEGGDMKQWYHPACIFETFVRARATTKKIEDPDDVEGFDDLQQEDKDVMQKLIDDFLAKSNAKGKGKAPKKAVAQSKLPFSPSKVKNEKDDSFSADPSTNSDANGHAPPKFADGDTERDNSFRQFRRLCADIAEENSYTGKTALVSNYLRKGNSGTGYKGDVYLLMKLLLPGVVKTVYNLNNKQLVKLFSQIFGTSLKAMVEDLDQGDVAETVRVFFETNKNVEPLKKSVLSLQEVDGLLISLAKLTKEDEQLRLLTKIAKRCTGNDLKMVVRLIKHDLRINSGAKHILDGLDPNAYEAFQASRNLKDVVERVQANAEESKPGMKKKLSVRASLMTPVLPMLAEACRSVEQAMKKCPNGFYAEIKYDGERVQVHKRADEFRYFSRSLKPVLPHKVAHFKEFIPKAFPSGDDLILDAEVLLVDTKTGKPLPFGTLGVHKKAAFSEAKVCLFVFDCLHINGENLMDRPIKKRRAILQDNMQEIPNRIMFSEYEHIMKPSDLQTMMDKVFREGLEGLVLKDVNSHYEPGKRHWLKVKKDYLHQGSMADSADLVVLGAYYGTGNKGGMMSIFLLGVYDPKSKLWCTVTKCGSGLDDKMLERLNKEMDMVKISKNFAKVPLWLNIKKPLTPDFVVTDPKKAPVWEIIGAEFSKAEVHTADGISIRFPRIQKFRDDKNWENATDLPRLKVLYKESKEKSDIVVPKTTGNDESNGNGARHSNGGDSDSMDMDIPVKKTPVKRQAEDEGLTTPTKKPKPECKYGSTCYQTSPAHKAVFCHPAGGSTPQKSPSKPLTPGVTSSSNKLPNIFTGCKIFLPETTEQFKQLKRYIIAFDGDLLPEFSKGSATHIVSSKGKIGTVNSKAKVVTPEWLWQSIKKKRLASTDVYRP
ncbi:DNA ligase 3-like isoform X2 [Haliotis asinina]|uniref:DNA ligase 3-like isoform X2 n=1 Tax=Haliotis asinina TaxID=109174 RepID=UPI0035318584